MTTPSRNRTVRYVHELTGAVWYVHHAGVNEPLVRAAMAMRGWRARRKG